MMQRHPVFTLAATLGLAAAALGLRREDDFSALDALSVGVPVTCPPEVRSVMERLPHPKEMGKSRFTEAQIFGMIKEQWAGLPTSELCWKHGLGPATFCRLKAKCGGMDLSDTKRLKQPEDENAEPTRLVADAMPDKV